MTPISIDHVTSQYEIRIEGTTLFAWRGLEGDKGGVSHSQSNIMGPLTLKFATMIFLKIDMRYHMGVMKMRGKYMLEPPALIKKNKKKQKTIYDKIFPIHVYTVDG